MNRREKTLMPTSRSRKANRAKAREQARIRKWGPLLPLRKLVIQLRKEIANARG